MTVTLSSAAQAIYDSLPEHEQEYLNWLATIIGDEISEWIINNEEIEK